MKKTLNTLFAMAFVLMLGASINAQTISSGTVDFSVTVNNAFDIRSGGAATGLNGMSVTGGVTANNALSATVTVADASPNVDNSVMTASVPVRLRSNAPYKLNATRTGSSTASLPDFESSDIAMSVTFAPRSGALVASGSDQAVAAFAGNVGALSSTATEIANGSRISTSGNTVSTDNYVTANLNFSAPRLFYTPTSTPYTDQVTISILAP